MGPLLREFLAAAVGAGGAASVSLSAAVCGASGGASLALPPGAPANTLPGAAFAAREAWLLPGGSLGALPLPTAAGAPMGVTLRIDDLSGLRGADGGGVGGLSDGDLSAALALLLRKAVGCGGDNGTLVRAAASGGGGGGGGDVAAALAALGTAFDGLQRALAVAPPVPFWACGAASFSATVTTSSIRSGNGAAAPLSGSASVGIAVTSAALCIAGLVIAREHNRRRAAKRRAAARASAVPSAEGAAATATHARSPVAFTENPMHSRAAEDAPAPPAAALTAAGGGGGAAAAAAAALRSFFAGRFGAAPPPPVAHTLPPAPPAALGSYTVTDTVTDSVNGTDTTGSGTVTGSDTVTGVSGYTENPLRGAAPAHAAAAPAAGGLSAAFLGLLGPRGPRRAPLGADGEAEAGEGAAPGGGADLLLQAAALTGARGPWGGEKPLHAAVSRPPAAAPRAAGAAPNPLLRAWASARGGPLSNAPAAAAAAAEGGTSRGGWAVENPLREAAAAGPALTRHVRGSHRLLRDAPPAQPPPPPFPGSPAEF